MDYTEFAFLRRIAVRIRIDAAVVTDRVAWSVGLFVTVVSRAKNG